MSISLRKNELFHRNRSQFLLLLLLQWACRLDFVHVLNKMYLMCVFSAIIIITLRCLWTMNTEGISGTHAEKLKRKKWPFFFADDICIEQRYSSLKISLCKQQSNESHKSQESYNNSNNNSNRAEQSVWNMLRALMIRESRLEKYLWL